jgi:acetylornithine deacetylase/succinyl-diaminopimelate desuccinylase-like protein
LARGFPCAAAIALYGRGAQDDGYAAFCALTAIEAVQQAGAPHARLVVLF